MPCLPAFLSAEPNIAGVPKLPLIIPDEHTAAGHHRLGITKPFIVSLAIHISVAAAMMYQTVPDEDPIVLLPPEQGRASVALMASFASPSTAAPQPQEEMLEEESPDELPEEELSEPRPIEAAEPAPARAAEVLPAVAQIKPRPKQVSTSGAELPASTPSIPATVHRPAATQPAPAAIPRAIVPPEALLPRQRSRIAPPQPSIAELEADIPAAASKASPASSPSEGAKSDPPRVVQNMAPRYPAAALAARQTGRVIVRVEVDAAGHVSAARVRRSSGFTLLDEAALQAVRRWRFSTAAGTAIRRADVPVDFVLR